MNASSVRGAATSALLDPTESALRARPLRSWQAAHKETVRARLATVYRDWSDEWLPRKMAAVPSGNVEVIEPHDALVMCADNTVCWSFEEVLRRTAVSALDAPSGNSRDSASSALQALGERMFAFDLTSFSSAPTAPVIAPALVRSAWTDWLQRLNALWPGFALEPQQPTGTPGMHVPAGPWSGALCARWTWCGGIWCLGLPYAVVSALLGSEAAPPSASVPPPRMVPTERLDRALAAEAVALRVGLDGAELNLGQLQELRLDDVVPLSHLLDVPALVTAVDGTPVCHGWLGQSEGRMAVELTPKKPSVHPMKENTP